MPLRLAGYVAPEDIEGVTIFITQLANLRPRGKHEKQITAY
jgi:hypothetical protein